MMDRLEDHYGIGFSVQDLDLGEEGHTDPIAREIVVDTEVYTDMLAGKGRARFTCTHEVGHLPHLRQAKDIIRDGGPRLARRLNVDVPIFRDPEWQADGIAAGLLMPRSTVPLVYSRGGVAAVRDCYQVSTAAAVARVNVLRGLGAF
jgi:hypothetical protein